MLTRRLSCINSKDTGGVWGKPTLSRLFGGVETNEANSLMCNAKILQASAACFPASEVFPTMLCESCGEMLAGSGSRGFLFLVHMRPVKSIDCKPCETWSFLKDRNDRRNQLEKLAVPWLYRDMITQLLQLHRNFPRSGLRGHAEDRCG